MRFARLAHRRLRFARPRIGIAQSGFGQGQGVGSAPAVGFRFGHQIGQLGATRGQIGRHVLIAGQFFFTGGLARRQRINMTARRLLALRPLLLVITQTLNARIACFAARFQPVKRTALFAMRQSGVFHHRARRVDSSQQFFLSAEILQFGIGRCIAAIQLGEVVGKAAQAGIQRFQFFVLGRHRGLGCSQQFLRFDQRFVGFLGVGARCVLRRAGGLDRGARIVLLCHGGSGGRFGGRDFCSQFFQSGALCQSFGRAGRRLGFMAIAVPAP